MHVNPYRLFYFICTNRFIANQNILEKKKIDIKKVENEYDERQNEAGLVSKKNLYLKHIHSEIESALLI